MQSFKLAGSVAGMCFDNKTASPPREVVNAAHVVDSMEECKTECWNSVSIG